ncbi:MAG: translation initiation factor IF-3 [Myxococcales bacterium]|nr:translation initiation factor IF-3 [Myxococcales bacterium]
MAFPTREKKDTTRINDRIRAREIRVIGSDGEQLGVMQPEDALRRAQEEGLDLVEVAPGSQPPVCRIMDYGRYKYEQKKKANKSKSHSAALKEVKLRPRTDEHDLGFKLRNARKFLMEGDKVKVTLMFRGREMVHRRLGYDQLDVVKERLVDIAKVEAPPRMEGRFLSMIMVPDREAIKEAAKKAAEDEKATADDSTAGAEEPAAKAEAAGTEKPAAKAKGKDPEKSAGKTKSAGTEKPAAKAKSKDAERPEASGE